MKKVMVFGTFDKLHPGHINFFEQAKKHGDYLIVVVARDQRVREIKGNVLCFDENKRLEMIKEQKVVDDAVLGDKVDVYKVVKEKQPDVICLGYDQEKYIGKLPDKLKEFGLNTKIIRLKSYHPDKYKSSKMVCPI